MDKDKKSELVAALAGILGELVGGWTALTAGVLCTARFSRGDDTLGLDFAPVAEVEDGALYK